MLQLDTYICDTERLFVLEIYLLHYIIVAKLPDSEKKSFMESRLSQSVPALRAARTEQPAVAEMPTHSFVQPATRLKL